MDIPRPNPLRTSLLEQLEQLGATGVPDAATDVCAEDLAFPGGAVTLLRPRSWHALLEAEQAAGRSTPYWAIPWPSAIALTRAVAELPLAGRRVVELGCGLGLPSMGAARAGAEVLATDVVPVAVAYAAHNLAVNDLAGGAAVADWLHGGDALAASGPWDVVLASDVMYSREGAERLAALLPRLVDRGEAVIADPGRAGCEVFLELTAGTWEVTTEHDGDVALHRLRPAAQAPASSAQTSAWSEA